MMNELKHISYYNPVVVFNDCVNKCYNFYTKVLPLYIYEELDYVVGIPSNFFQQKK